MMLSTVYLAAEDMPGLAAGRKLVAEHAGLSIYREENARGFGNLKRKVANYDQMGARGLPVLLLTDLDADPCPGGKVLAWLGHQPSPGFLLRICVREVEAWLLADTEATAEFLRIRQTALPPNPELLADPKATLIQLAQKAPKKIRVGLTPVGKASIGPDYNDLLREFILDDWSIDRATRNAPSLARARTRIAELAARVAT